jgi:hypothetical protein
VRLVDDVPHVGDVRQLRLVELLETPPGSGAQEGARRHHDVIARAAGEQLGFENLVGIEDVVDDLDAGFLGEVLDDRFVDIVGPVVDVDDLFLRPSAAGTIRAPVAKKARPTPRLIAPKANNSTASAWVVEREATCVKEKTAARIVPRQVAGVMRTWEKRRVITVAIEKPMAITSARPSPMGETLPVSDSETIIATPQITAAIAAQVLAATFSPNSTKASSAANSGTPACIKRILATVV